MAINNILEQKPTDVQLEDGYICIATPMYEAIMIWDFTKRERKVIDAIIRQTWGWKKKTDYIALSVFERLTGITKNHISKILNSLVARKIIKKNKSVYSLNKNISEWDEKSTKQFSRKSPGINQPISDSDELIIDQLDDCDDCALNQFSSTTVVQPSTTVVQPSTTVVEKFSTTVGTTKEKKETYTKDTDTTHTSEREENHPQFFESDQGLVIDQTSPDRSATFEQFKAAYPNKLNFGLARKIWSEKNLDCIGQNIIEWVQIQTLSSFHVQTGLTRFKNAADFLTNNEFDHINQEFLDYERQRVLRERQSEASGFTGRKLSPLERIQQGIAATKIRDGAFMDDNEPALRQALGGFLQ